MKILGIPVKEDPTEQGPTQCRLYFGELSCRARLTEGICDHCSKVILLNWIKESIQEVRDGKACCANKDCDKSASPEPTLLAVSPTMFERLTKIFGGRAS